MAHGRIYVETLIHADLTELWERTQDPIAHQRWDFRFHEITYLDPAEQGGRRFRYAVRVLPGLEISGVGISAGERHRPDGTRTSALRFSSVHPLSLIRSGSGYWRYVPDGEGVRFLTGYDYTVGWGLLGRAADLIFRPLMGWGTAWSFDRLRLWLETGRTPERALRQALLEALLRVTVPVGALPYEPGLAAALAILAVILPPLPGTPAARRCLRRPSGAGRSGRPAVLSRLEKP